jgi:hypothetical protein
MTIPCRLSIDAGTPIAVPATPFVVLQGTNAAGTPAIIKRLRLTSNQTGANQQIVGLQFVTYATATSTGGTTPAAAPIDDRLVGLYTPATLFRAGTATMGTTPTVKWMDQWNTANPYDLLDGLVELQSEFAAAKVWAIIMPSGPVSTFNLTGTTQFVE